MRLIIFLSLLLSSLLFGNEQVTIYTSSMQTKSDIVKINNDVVITYGKYIITAKKALYNKKTGILELFHEVKISDGDVQKIIGKYAKINFRDKKRIIKPFYMFERPTQVWLNADKGCAEENRFDIASGTISGCDPLDPLWQIDFTSSDYDGETKWLNIYNAILYIYDIPVFYLPYFGYSLDRTRRTGLLMPSFGYSNDEGIYYAQSLYIAEQNWWDLELRPQIRTQRGSGIYGTFRFVDTKTSKGSIKFGYFKEKESYFQKYNLANKKHYGFNIDYINDDFLTSWFHIHHNGQATLYLETNTMNDVDYINLATNNTSRSRTSSQTLSRMNAFYNTDRQYFATYMKYYMDLTQESNSQTLQQLPTLHYHNYLHAILDNHLLYNVDLRVNNLYRAENTTATQANLSIPLALRTTLFDEFLNIAYQTQLFTQYSQFHTDNHTPQPSNFQNGFYTRNYNSFSLASQLIKPYQNFIHSVNFTSSYIRSGFEKRDGFYQDHKGIDCHDHKNDDVCEFYNISNIQEAISLNFTQYFYDKSNEQILYHRLTNIIAKDDNEGYTVGELENELDTKLGSYWSFYNNFRYNFKKDKFSKQYNKLSFHYNDLSLSLAHLYKKNLNATNALRDSYLSTAVNYRYNSHYSYKASLDYDTVRELKKKIQVGFLYQKRCWDFGLQYVENNRPILLNDNTPASVYDRYIYLTLLLKPIMGSSSANFFGLRLPQVLSGN